MLHSLAYASASTGSRWLYRFTIQNPNSTNAPPATCATFTGSPNSRNARNAVKGVCTSRSHRSDPGRKMPQRIANASSAPHPAIRNCEAKW
jgi:hypothetical protein